MCDVTSMAKAVTTRCITGLGTPLEDGAQGFGAVPGYDDVMAFGLATGANNWLLAFVTYRGPLRTPIIEAQAYRFELLCQEGCFLNSASFGRYLQTFWMPSKKRSP